MPLSRHRSLIALFAAALLAAGPGWPAQSPAADSAGSAALGVHEAQIDAGYWIAHLAQPDRVLLDREAIAQINANLLAQEPSLHDIAGLPSRLEAERVRRWIQARSAKPTRTLHDDDGKQVTERNIHRLMDSLALESIPTTQLTRYGMVVRRADLRTFPTRLRVFREPGDTDIDRFQESALFPGTPVAIVHESRDRAWYFVVGPNYAAWIEKRHVAHGDKQAIFQYARRLPFLVVSGATARSVQTPEQPQVSGLQLDMGVRVPLLDDWPADQAVNGQHPGFAHVIELPTRSESGALGFTPALLPRNADVAGDYLPLTRANLLGQAFKFLGERYGWGHAYDARDCSGFVAEVHRSFGLQLPRNTGDQAAITALGRIGLDHNSNHAQRKALVADAKAGDLLYIPGHVMMVVGHVDGQPWVIHDIHGMNLRAADGGVRRLSLNSVVVTPLLPMLADDGTSIIDHITAIQRIAP